MSFVEAGDVTITVDPIRRDHWIYDGHTRHEQTQERGLRYDTEAFRQVLNWEKAGHSAVSFFNPTVRQLDSLSKFASREPEPHCPGFTSSRVGKLPVILQQLYQGSLQNKSTATIEHEMREADRRSASRLFDTSGYTR